MKTVFTCQGSQFQAVWLQRLCPNHTAVRRADCLGSSPDSTISLPSLMTVSKLPNLLQPRSAHSQNRSSKAAVQSWHSTWHRASPVLHAGCRHDSGAGRGPRHTCWPLPTSPPHPQATWGPCSAPAASSPSPIPSSRSAT